MKPTLTIHVPEPCHEDWNKMTPKDNGSFCGSCEKTVVDFSKMNDEQIAQYVMAHPNEKMCGRFANTQLDRSLAISKSQDVTALKAFIYILFMVFGSSLFSYTYVKNNEDKMMSGMIENKMNEESRMTVGTMIMPYVQPVVVDSTENEITVTEGPSQSMTMGGMMAEIQEPMDPHKEYTINSQKNDPIECTTMGGMMYRTEYIDNSLVNFFPPDSIATEKKDSVSQKIIDQVKLPTLESYPNPTNGNINIKYNIPVRTDVLIEIYDINGNKMKDLVSTSQMYEGSYIYPADLSDLANGTYICRMIAGERSFSTKIMVEK